MVIHPENTFVITLLQKKNVLFTDMPAELGIFRLFGNAALIIKLQTKIMIAFSSISMKKANLQETDKKMSPLRKM